MLGVTLWSFSPQNDTLFIEHGILKMAQMVLQDIQWNFQMVRTKMIGGSCEQVVKWMGEKVWEDEIVLQCFSVQNYLTAINDKRLLIPFNNRTKRKLH